MESNFLEWKSNRRISNWALQFTDAIIVKNHSLTLKISEITQKLIQRKQENQKQEVIKMGSGGGGLEPYPRKNMELPEGKTCKDCFHFERTCIWLIQCKPNRKTCDWSPSKFVEIKKA